MFVIIRPHRPYYVRRCGLYRDAIWVEDSGGPREPCVRLGFRSHHGKGQFWGGKRRPIVKYRDTAVTCAKTPEPIVMPFGLCARTGLRNRELDGSRSPMRRGNIGGKDRPLLSIGTFCGELCRSGWTDRFAVWVVDSGGLEEAQVESYSPGDANVLTWKGTFAPSGEYD